MYPKYRLLDKWNRIGPETEPCGTAKTMYPSDSVLYDESNCDLYLKDKIFTHDTPRIHRFPVSSTNYRVECLSKIHKNTKSGRYYVSKFYKI